MGYHLNSTHDPARRSWLDSANDPAGDFPLQNLPFGLFRSDGAPRGAVALGDCLIDLQRLVAGKVLESAALTAAAAACGPSLLPLFAQPPQAISALRAQLFELYAADSPAAARHRPLLNAALVPQREVELLIPGRPAAFTDFCCSIDHIRRMAAANGAPLRAACTSLPIAYNARASSIVASGTAVRRPLGQFSLPGSPQVLYGPEPWLDFELEVGVWLRPCPDPGRPISVAEAESLLFGCCLVNDWSARAIQFFESVLGPFLGKTFLTSISPWVVTLEALAPFRTAARGRSADEPAVPAHLLDAADRDRGGIDIELTAELSTPSMRAAGASQKIVRTRFRDMFWTFAQMAAHAASNGCPLEAGELLASGTASGPTDDSRACLAEITHSGALELPGERRTWLEDGDEITLRGRAQAPGFVAIGFGECRGRIAAAGGVA